MIWLDIEVARDATGDLHERSTGLSDDTDRQIVFLEYPIQP